MFWVTAGPYMERAMQYIRTFWHDLKLSVGTGYTQWRYIRKHLRRGGNPDQASF
jgi:hypothetical protein